MVTGGKGVSASVFPLVLAGMPGSGKSTVGRLLARKLACEFTDTDKLVAQEARVTIAEIFAQEGEPAFRRYETAALKTALADDSPRVIALGGGTVLSATNREMLDGHTVIYLETSLATLQKRVGSGRGRPLLSTDVGGVRQRLEALLRERAPLYEAVAAFTVSTEGRKATVVADYVLETLGLVQARR